MMKEKIEEIITELTNYWNMATNIIERDEIGRKIKKYKEKLKELQN